MAKLYSDDWAGLMLSLEEIAELPDDVAEEMLDAEAEIVLAAQRSEAEKLGKYSGYDTHNNTRDTSPTNSLPGQTRSYSTGELARSIKKGKMQVKGGKRSKRIYFSGSRKRGKTRTKNSEIAFLNEFGSRTINARNFIRVANEKSADAAVEAAAKVHDAFLKSKNL